MKTKTLLTLATLALASLGCTVTRFDAGPGVGATQYTVAWPWLDTSRSLAKAQLTAATNKATLSLTGMNETETGGSNAVRLVESAVGAAVGAAVKAVK